MQRIYPNWPTKVYTTPGLKQQGTVTQYNVQIQIFDFDAPMTVGQVIKQGNIWFPVIGHTVSKLSFKNRYEAVDHLVRYAYAKELKRLMQQERQYNKQTEAWGFEPEHSRFPAPKDIHSPAPTPQNIYSKGHSMKRDRRTQLPNGRELVGSVSID